MTDLELQLYLAARLPERIRCFNDDNSARGGNITPYFYWREVTGAGHHIKDTEWLHVCWLIEQEFSDRNKRRFAFELTKQVFPGWSKHPSDCTELGLAWIGQFDMANASWQQRTRALIATLG